MKSSDDSKKKCKIGILSLGCPRNLVDSESILGRLNFKGYPVVELNQADVAVVNTCAFIEEAKKESIEAILDLIELKKEKKLRKIIVYGCLSQRYRDALRKNLPEIDAFVGRVSLNHSPERYSITPRHYAYLKICEGCINSCSYCAIPGIKGGFSSLDTDTIIKKAKQLDKEGVSEINVIGQDITGFGLDLYGELRLPALIKEIIKECSAGWIRLLYLYPNRIKEELLELIESEPRICKYIDLPIQHINDRMLRLMNRAVTKKEILKLIERIRKRMPHAALRTSIIAGFPGESDSEFRELLDFIEEVRFERLGAFIYSREEGTAAYNFKDQIPKRIKLERFNMIMASQQKVSAGINKTFLGKTLEVLIEEKQESCEGVYLGRSQYDAPEVDGLVYVSSRRKLSPGGFARVKITGTLEYDLIGEAL